MNNYFDLNQMGKNDVEISLYVLRNSKKIISTSLVVLVLKNLYRSKPCQPATREYQTILANFLHRLVRFVPQKIPKKLDLTRSYYTILSPLF